MKLKSSLQSSPGHTGGGRAYFQRKAKKEANITMRKKAFRAAFPYTIPIFAGFWFLALAYGIYMNANGFSFVYPMLMSMARTSSPA